MSVSNTRTANLQYALRLEYLTVGWNLIEGIIAVYAALQAGSIALLGFGADSFVESASGGILIWRLAAEQHTADSSRVEALDRRAHKLVAMSLFALAGYIAFDAITALLSAEPPEPTLVGMVIATISIAVMIWLARAKRHTALVLGSRALEADSFQTTACWWLSLVTLGGIGLNASLGWWWADPVAALAMTYFLVREGRGAWRSQDCCA